MKTLTETDRKRVIRRFADAFVQLGTILMGAAVIRVSFELPLAIDQLYGTTALFVAGVLLIIFGAILGK